MSRSPAYQTTRHCKREGGQVWSLRGRYNLGGTRRAPSKAQASRSGRTEECGGAHCKVYGPRQTVTIAGRCMAGRHSIPVEHLLLEHQSHDSLTRQLLVLYLVPTSQSSLMHHISFSADHCSGITGGSLRLPTDGEGAHHRACACRQYPLGV